MSFRRPQEESPLDAPPLSATSGILVVDEDPAFQLGLKTFLREYVGFEKVFTARSGQEALDFLQAEPSIEVITVDYRMPGMSGIELLRALRESLDRPVAALMITGYPSEEVEAEFRALGTSRLLATHFLTKPVQFEKLEPVVLAAHEEVQDAKRRAEEREFTALANDEEEVDLPIATLAGKIELQSLRIAEVERELKAQRGKWRADFWKAAFVVLLFWLATQFGLIQRLEPYWEQFKIAAKESFVIPKKAAVEETSTEALVPEEGEDVDRGEPL